MGVSVSPEATRVGSRPRVGLLLTCLARKRPRCLPLSVSLSRRCPHVQDVASIGWAWRCNTLTTANTMKWIGADGRC